jgi:hypothetical protein
MLPIEEAPDPISVPGGSRPPPAGIDFNATATTSDSGSGSLSRSPSTGIADDKIKEMTRQTRVYMGCKFGISQATQPAEPQSAFQLQVRIVHTADLIGG